jgi:hypothetical protein
MTRDLGKANCSLSTEEASDTGDGKPIDGADQTFWSTLNEIHLRLCSSSRGSPISLKQLISIA